MRFLSALVLFVLLGSSAVFAQQREDIVLTGGCALRFMEHGKGAVSHDVYWFNFVDASVIRLQQLKQQNPGDILTWLIYKPSYARRSQEMGVDLLAQLQQKANSVGARLVWFSSKEELISYLNQGFDRDKVKIADFDYFWPFEQGMFSFRLQQRDRHDVDCVAAREGPGHDPSRRFRARCLLQELGLPLRRDVQQVVEEPF